MDWTDDAVIMVRMLIGDFTQPYAYCDDRLFDLFMLGARLTVLDVGFPEGYIVNLTSSTITPTPDSDSALLVLASLKASYVIANSEYKAKAAGAVSITDGPSSISLTGTATAFKARVDQLRQDYEQAKMQYVLGNAIGTKITTTPTTTGNYSYPSQYINYYDGNQFYGQCRR